MVCMELPLKKWEIIFFLAISVREEDMKEVLDKSPWSFDSKQILLKRFHEGLSPSNVSFQYSPFLDSGFQHPY